MLKANSYLPICCTKNASNMIKVMKLPVCYIEDKKLRRIRLTEENTLE